MPAGRRKASSPPSREYISKAKAQRQSENRKELEGMIPNQNHGTQHQDHTESEARMGTLSLLSRFRSSTTTKEEGGDELRRVCPFTRAGWVEERVCYLFPFAAEGIR